MWTDECLDEMALPFEELRWCAIDQGCELGFVFLERRRGSHQATREVQQQLEVQRPFVLLPNLVEVNRHDGSPRDRGLDEGARRDADDRGAVIERVEIVVAGVVLDRVVTEERDIAKPPQIGRASCRERG